MDNYTYVDSVHYDIFIYNTHMLHGAGIYTNLGPKHHPNVGKYTIHGAYGI